MSGSAHPRDERGASAVEYGLLAVAIAAVLVVVLYALGGMTQQLFTDSCDEIKSEASTTADCS